MGPEGPEKRRKGSVPEIKPERQKDSPSSLREEVSRLGKNLQRLPQEDSWEAIQRQRKIERHRQRFRRWLNLGTEVAAFAATLRLIDDFIDRRTLPDDLLNLTVKFQPEIDWERVTSDSRNLVIIAGVYALARFAVYLREKHDKEKDSKDKNE